MRTKVKKTEINKEKDRAIDRKNGGNKETKEQKKE